MTKAPSRGAAARPLKGFVTDDPVLALTFDDGPDPSATGELLDILSRHRARATFFVLGEQAVRSPSLLERMLNEGHAVGNHSWDHPSFLDLGPQERRDQIVRCDNSIRPYGAGLFRPPYGLWDAGVLEESQALGHRLVMWTRSGDDWLGHGGAWIFEKIMREIAPGSIVVLHDGLSHPKEPEWADRSATLEAVERVLTALAGPYEFCSLPELLERGYPTREARLRT